MTPSSLPHDLFILNVSEIWPTKIMKTDVIKKLLSLWWNLFKFYLLVPPTLDFFADFCWDKLGHWINIYNLHYHIVVLKKKNGKTVKNCSSRILFGQKLGQHGPRPKWSSIFFLEITKGDHKFSRTFYFIKVHNYLLTYLSWTSHRINLETTKYSATHIMVIYLLIFLSQLPFTSF